MSIALLKEELRYAVKSSKEEFLAVVAEEGIIKDVDSFFLGPDLKFDHLIT